MGLPLGYQLLNLSVVLLLFVIGFKAINSAFDCAEKVKIKKVLLVLGLLLWQCYIFGLGQTDLLSSLDLPPRFAIFLIAPAFIFTAIFIYTNRNNSWLDCIPQSWLIYFQSFRILVETLFVLSIAEGVLHPNVTIEGYNFDMIMGVTAPIIAFLAFEMRILSKKNVILWNYIGLAVLASVIFVFTTTVFFPQFYGSSENLMSVTFTSYPYTLVTGFLMPVAVFIHVLSIVQLRKISE